jgi:hypothetical protein
MYREKGREYSRKRNKVELGKKMTIPGQAQDIKDLVQAYVSGFPLPLAKDEINLNVDISELTEDMFDFPDLEQYARLDPVEQFQVKNNLNQFIHHITSEFNNLKGKYDNQDEVQASDNNPNNDPIKDAPKGA